ncbi:MAG TPA: hypothetical protein VGO91_16600 [Pyrinomonadaceae bacterium]|jgi:hypothetical protein|nr:hypothetical protein [Pyrinomonadaceae bacterium]
MATAAKKRELDFSSFPTGAVTEYTKLLCLACIFDVFTAQLGLAPRTAYSEVKRYAPTVEELTGGKTQRPYFESEEKHPRCPYCDSAKRWHARLDTYRIEGGKATDAARRALLKTLPKSEEQFTMIETKTDRRALLFEWLDSLGRTLDFEDDAWLIETTRAFLARTEPKTDWTTIFEGLRAVRRSNRIEEGYERDGARLFLAPALYDDALLVQYLVSRSHKHGGRTLEGRLTLQELVRRMRHRGHLNAQGITERDQFDVLEKLVEHLTGAEGAVKLYYILDRRDFLEKVKTVYARYAA